MPMPAHLFSLQGTEAAELTELFNKLNAACFGSQLKPLPVFYEAEVNKLAWAYFASHIGIFLSAELRKDARKRKRWLAVLHEMVHYDLDRRRVKCMDHGWAFWKAFWQARWRIWRAKVRLEI